MKYKNYREYYETLIPWADIKDFQIGQMIWDAAVESMEQNLRDRAALAILPVLMARNSVSDRTAICGSFELANEWLVEREKVK